MNARRQPTYAKNALTNEFEKGFSIWPDAKADAGSDLDAKFANQILPGLEASRSGYKGSLLEQVSQCTVLKTLLSKS